ncbi:MAG TPA: hypothetical protein VIJ27_08820 [Mucilaginibacter sp.]
MPINEIENHPYLFDQVNNFQGKDPLAKYCKLIVGTFPIYAITNSNPPIAPLGVQKRALWFLEAFIQYFYGSRKNYFWRLFATAFNEPVPITKQQAIELLDKYKFLMTDVFTETGRIGYSSLDSALVNSVENGNIIDLIQNSENLRIIYFTSWNAKKLFSRIVVIPFVKIIDNIQPIFGVQYRMIVLISPAGNGRTVSHFKGVFPLLQEEKDNRTNGNGYALAYRQRYYSNYLPIPCQI